MTPDPSRAPDADSSAPGGGGDGDATILGTIRRLGPVSVLGAAWAAVPALAGFALILHFIGPVAEWLDGLGPLGPVVFVAAFALTAGLGLLPTYAQAVVAGWVFGFAGGTGLAIAGFTGASIVGYLVARAVSRERIESVLAEHPRAVVVRDALVGRGFGRSLGIVSLVRMPPNSPFALTNLALAGVGVRFPVYVLGTAIGMTPRTAAVAGVAAAGAATGAADIVDLATGRKGWLVGVGIVLTIVVLAVITQIANRALAAVVDTHSEAEIAARADTIGDDRD